MIMQVQEKALFVKVVGEIFALTEVTIIKCLNTS